MSTHDAYNMKTDLQIVTEILNHTGITKSKLAEMLDVSRQFIGQLFKGEKKLSNTKREQLKQMFPTFFDEVAIPDKLTVASLLQYRQENNYSRAYLAKILHISESLLTKIELGERPLSEAVIGKFNTYIASASSKTITLKYEASSSLKSDFLPTPLINLTKTIVLDKNIVPDITPHTSFIIEVGDDTLSPYWDKGDKLIVDTSCKHFIDGNVYVFLYNNRCYARKVNVLPDKIKCIALNSEYDTFYLDNDGGKHVVVGKIVPKFRY